ncbi:MAG: Ig-like domain-containing protein [Candidatus Thermoplasmatota archaeon]|nr:Ig-like domain-containing protein [Candidatus Thermoplasmatota archaeon]
MRRTGAFLLSALFIMSIFTGIVASSDPTRLMTIYHNATVYVNVTHTNGTPGKDLYVSASHLKNGNGLTLTTDEGGEVKFDLLPGMWGPVRFFVMTNHYKLLDYHHIFIEPDGVYYANISIRDPDPDINNINGRITDKSTGLPIQSASVTLYGQNPIGNSFSRSTTTGADGRYAIDFPNSSRSFSLYAHNSDHFGLSANLVFISGQRDYTLDLDLTPKYSASENSTISFLDKKSDELLLGGYMDIRGYQTELDHSYSYWYSFEPDVTGAFDVGLGPGEYILQRSYPMGNNCTIRFESSIFPSTVPTNIEIPVGIPDLSLLKVEVWNDTSPLQDVYVSYIHYIDGDHVRGSTSTDAGGKAQVGIPTDAQVEIDFNKFGYEARYIKVDPETQTLNVTLKKAEAIPHKVGSITMTPIDPETGFSVPAYISGDGESDEGRWIYFYKQTNTTGVFTGEVPAGTYRFIEVIGSLGSAVLENVTIKEGLNPDLEIPLTRYDLGWPPEVKNTYSVRIVDGKGDPVPFSTFYIWTSDPETWNTLMTDQDGILRFHQGIGPVELFTYQGTYYERGRWSIPLTSFDLDGTGGSLPDITAYRTGPLEPIHGSVLDARTGEDLKNVNIETYSVRLLEAYDGNMMSYDVRAAPIHQMNVRSSHEGFYRVWGKDTTFLHAYKEGYFPVNERFEMRGTRAIDHDIYLMPVPEFSLWVNGTLLDEDSDPVEGYVYVVDDEHPDFEIAWNTTGENGEFALHLYPGNFTIHYGNDTLYDSIGIEVLTDVDDLMLYLVPRSLISVHVGDLLGMSVAGAMVTLELQEGSDHVEFGIQETDSDGGVQFMAPAGTYRIVVARSDIYDRYVSDPFTVDGWEEKDLSIVLSNRSTGDVSLKVTGSGGPFADGIPQALVEVNDGDEAFLAAGTTDDEGNLVLENIPFGDHVLKVSPPEHLSFVDGVRSGYVVQEVNISLEEISASMEAQLEYMVTTPSEYLNITNYSPKGSGISLDAPVLIGFSHAVNIASLQGAIIIDPELENATIQYIDDQDGRTVRIDHDLFLPNTTYSVIIGPTVISVEGYPLWQGEGLSWSFTTGEGILLWEIYSAYVGVNDHKNVSVNVFGREAMDVYIIIQGIGSFPVSEGDPGSYSALIPGTNFAWDALYSYHFSNASDGEDLAPILSGTFRTPEEPALPPGTWHITSAVVTVLKNKDWDVSVQGGAGLDIYVVISGVGSFKIIEGDPGRYELMIPGDNFEYDVEYSYHFSDRSGGDPMQGYESFNGNLRTPERGASKGPSYLAYCGIGCFALVVFLLMLIIVLILVLRGKKRSLMKAEE